jgi:hypothetical protein
MEDAGADRAFEGHGAGLRHAMMIADARPGPSGFQLGPRAGNAAAGFAGDDDLADRRVGQINRFARGNFGEMQPVGGRAAQHGGAVVQDGAQTGGAVHAAAG